MMADPNAVPFIVVSVGGCIVFLALAVWAIVETARALNHLFRR